MKLTIDTFQQLYAISTLPMDEFDRSVKMIGIMTGKSEAEILDFSVAKFERFAKDVANSFEIITRKLQLQQPKNLIKTNGKYYRIHFNPAKEPLNAGRYVEITTFGSEPIANLHKIMASIVNPLKWSWQKMRFEMLPYDATKHDEVADDMLKADFAHAYHAAVFFYHVFKVSMQVSQDYLVMEKMQQGQTREMAMQSVSTLLNTLDGLQMPKWYQNLKPSL